MTALEFIALRPAAGRLWAKRALRAVEEAIRSWRNRQDMRRLHALTDWELTDIGLTREDLDFASEGPLTGDPTHTLDRLVRQRRRIEDAARRVA